MVSVERDREREREEWDMRCSIFHCEVKCVTYLLNGIEAVCYFIITWIIIVSRVIAKQSFFKFGFKFTSYIFVTFSFFSKQEQFITVIVILFFYIWVIWLLEKNHCLIKRVNHNCFPASFVIEVSGFDSCFNFRLYFSVILRQSWTGFHYPI